MPQTTSSVNQISLSDLNPFGLILRLSWAGVLKLWFFRYYMRLRVHGDFRKVLAKYPRLILISSHSSHLDATAILAALPLVCWKQLYIGVAKDYFFKGYFLSLFSKYCLRAVPISRKGSAVGGAQICLNLLKEKQKAWLLLFPEGSRSADGSIQKFKGGVSLFSEKTQTPILFIYVDSANFWPKGRRFARPGEVKVYVGPILPPSPIESVDVQYRDWIGSLKTDAFI